jgi:hypothetical protein
MEYTSLEESTHSIMQEESAMTFDQAFFGVVTICFMCTGLAAFLLSIFVTINRKHIKSEHRPMFTTIGRLALFLGLLFVPMSILTLWRAGWQTFPAALLPGLAACLLVVLLYILFGQFFPKQSQRLDQALERLLQKMSKK